MTEPPPPPLPAILAALRTARLEQVAAAGNYEFIIASLLLGTHVDRLLDHHEREEPP